MNLETIAASLRGYGRSGDFGLGKALHCHIIKCGFGSKTFICNNLISMYMDFCFSESAHKLFDEMPVRNVVSWTTLIAGYTHGGRPNEALKLFSEMEFSPEKPNLFTFSIALKACSIKKDLEQGRLIHDQISRANLLSDTILMNSLVDMYIKSGSLIDARKVFEGMPLKNTGSWNTMIAGYLAEGEIEEAGQVFSSMPEPDSVSWNTMIAGYAKLGHGGVMELVHRMHMQGLRLDGFTFPCALKACASLKKLIEGQQIHAYVFRLGFESQLLVVTALVDMYVKCGKTLEAQTLFMQRSDGEGSVRESLALSNSMLGGYVNNGHYGDALELISQMYKSGLRLDSFTFGNILKLGCDQDNVRLGAQVHGLVVAYGYHLDAVIGSSLVDLYAKCGRIEEAQRLFQLLPEQDNVTWASLIAACAHQGLSSQVFSIFKDMLESRVNADHFVLSSILKACSTLSALASGKQIHAVIVKRGYETEVITSTALVDMYSKCGEIEEGIAVFDGLRDRDIVSWTGIIVGCARNGRAKEAIGYFGEMLRYGVNPNEVTFVGILSACSHAGLIDDACRYFESMSHDHGVIPGIEHYSCMIDLLGRAGRFEEAKKLMACLPHDPDRDIWTAMLGACGIHGNVALGKHAAQCLMATSPNTISAYVTLSNAYARMGMWKESCMLREVIREKGMKEAGRSWVDA
ncbi:pentatricopeptide repeat-containing protein At4g08210 [Amborella trichopoda]|uniref:pentatricopeptide repeat-containing protein At4g08210 n=1 Tax=Amborella trichopoda TaxID=13333 RepID=UPI0005D365AE|nr:pentatricopeptide repeat-containing protein At4g08210 [Amborella trichopoda]|eukprot:XP_011624404.1 pentatricopeptide repeat-containing protein At4g08210 [Amborella trichopoda]